MDRRQQKLTITAGQLDAEALKAYARAYRYDTTAGLDSLASLLRRADFFDIRNSEGVIVGRYALRVNLKEHGREGEIVAAVGRVPGVDLVATVLPAIELQFEGVQSIRVVTRRRSLVAKLIAHGFEISHFVLRKAPAAAPLSSLVKASEELPA